MMHFALCPQATREPLQRFVPPLLQGRLAGGGWDDPPLQKASKWLRHYYGKSDDS